MVILQVACQPIRKYLRSDDPLRRRCCVVVVVVVDLVLLCQDS